MQYLTIVNRTQKVLEGTWDGKHYKIPPGRSQYPSIQAEKFKEQNPIMGTGDDEFGGKLYLIGIEDYNDDITPIEQSDAVELWDRRYLGPQMQKVDVVQGRSGLYSRSSVSDRPPVDTQNPGFVPPDK